MNPAPGFKKYPGHMVTTQPSRARVVVTLKGEVIADTREAVELHESQSSSHVLAPVVYYFPRKDVKMDRLARSSHKTHCPFKGRRVVLLGGGRSRERGVELRAAVRRNGGDQGPACVLSRQIRDQADLSRLPLGFTRGAACSSRSASA
jgi:hypothetical protein